MGVKMNDAAVSNFHGFLWRQAFFFTSPQKNYVEQTEPI
jgi:hypothetical protein